MARVEVTFHLRGDRIVTIAGEHHAGWEDNHYERLKERMKACENNPAEEISERGYCYDILEGEDEDCTWYLAKTPVRSVGHPSSRTEQRAPDGATTLRTFPSEDLLLDHMRRRLDPDDAYCPMRNLLGAWDRNDLLTRWLVEADWTAD